MVPPPSVAPSVAGGQLYQRIYLYWERQDGSPAPGNHGLRTATKLRPSSDLLSGLTELIIKLIFVDQKQTS